MTASDRPGELFRSCRRNDRHDEHDWQEYGHPLYCPGYDPASAEQEQQATDKAAALLAPIEAKVRELKARERAEHRTTVLREAADAIDSGKSTFPPLPRSGAAWAARMVRRMADETPQPVSPAYVRLQAAAKEATEAAHLHAMHGMKRVFQLARRYGTEAIPAAEVLDALGLDENANTVEAQQPEGPASYEQLADRLEAEHARRVKAAWSPTEHNAAEEWGSVAAFVRGVAREQQPAARTPFVPPAHYRRDDGVDCCVHAIPVGPDSCPACRELADDEEAPRG